MSFVAAGMVIGHQDDDNKAESVGDEEGEGKGNLLDGRLVVDCV